jgi:hypothetical protein
LEIGTGRVIVRPYNILIRQNIFADATILSRKSDFEVMGLISDINTEEI